MRLRRITRLAAVILAIGAVHSQRADAAEDEGKLGVLALPNVFSMPETGLGAGFMLMLTRPRPATQDGLALADSLRSGGSYTQNGQLSGWASMEMFLGQSRARFGVDVSISRYPSRFFGVGPSAASRTLDWESGGILATSGLTGSAGYLATGLGLNATYDSRDSSIVPTKGAYFDLGFSASPASMREPTWRRFPR